ncbi:MAG TPA: anti-sigma factor, partial [Vitreimonas sp.]|nr:anti-sigma factor [Vitreimonas sp.]
MTLPFRRRSDTWSSPHDRARARAAERLDGPLEAVENDWLEAHLDDCVRCRIAAEGFESDRLELRALRRQSIEPPRDLWARTAARIEQESRVPAGSEQAPSRRRTRPSPLPLGALAGLMVVAVVFGATLLSGQPVPSVEPRGTAPVVAMPPEPTLTASPRPTPIVVPAGDVDWLAVGDQGTIAIYKTAFSEVCPEEGAQCAPLDESTPGMLEIPGTPEHAVLSPDDAQVVVINTSGTTGGDTVWIVPVPSPGDTTSAPSPTPE